MTDIAHKGSYGLDSPSLATLVRRNSRGLNCHAKQLPRFRVESIFSDPHPAVGS